MPTRHHRRAKAVMGGMLWLMVRAPMDIALWQCQHQYMSYIVALQITDFFVLVFIFYQFLQYRARRPWKCPVCDGWGHRIYTPGMPSEMRSQLTRCSSCGGVGYIWEELERRK